MRGKYKLYGVYAPTNILKLVHLKTCSSAMLLCVWIEVYKPKCKGLYVYNPNNPNEIVSANYFTTALLLSDPT